MVLFVDEGVDQTLLDSMMMPTDNSPVSLVNVSTWYHTKFCSCCLFSGLALRRLGLSQSHSQLVISSDIDIPPPPVHLFFC